MQKICTQTLLLIAPSFDIFLPSSLNHEGNTMVSTALQSKLIASLNHLMDANKPDPFALEKYLAKGVGQFFRSEIKNEGLYNAVNTIRQSVKTRDLVFTPDRSLEEELNIRAERLSTKTYLHFKNEKYSSGNNNSSAAKIAQLMTEREIGYGNAVGLLFTFLL